MDNSGELPRECCRAKSKRSGQRCKKAPMLGKKVCYFHGGASTGRRTEEGKARHIAAVTKSGVKAQGVVKGRQDLRATLSEGRKLLDSIR